ncbi:hypothetical protein [Thermococcus sp.]
MNENSNKAYDKDTVRIINSLHTGLSSGALTGYPDSMLDKYPKLYKAHEQLRTALF